MEERKHVSFRELEDRSSKYDIPETPDTDLKGLENGLSEISMESSYNKSPRLVIPDTPKYTYRRPLSEIMHADDKYDEHSRDYPGTRERRSLESKQSTYGLRSELYPDMGNSYESSDLRHF